MAAAGDGLEVLGAHDRPHPSPPRCGIQVVDDAGKAHEVLPGGSYLGYLYIRVPQLPPDGLLAFQCLQPPEVTGVLYLRLAVLDKEIDGLFCPPLHDDGVKAGELQLCPPEIG